MDELRQQVSLTHVESGRRVPVEVTTVFGRSDDYYRYTDSDIRPERLRPDVVDEMAALNYIKLSSDDQVSRTHGMLDPAVPGVCDLNSTNGVQLNLRDIPKQEGEAGPLVSISHSDRIQIGRAVFEVAVVQTSSAELEARVSERRQAFVGSDHKRRDRAVAVKEFLEERKGFTVRDAIGWRAVIANFYRLQQAAHDEGVALCALFADVHGTDLVMDAERMAFAKLIPLLNNVEGRKVVVLEAKGDPSACEELFEQMAYEDSVLITSTGVAESLGGDSEELIVPSMQSVEMRQLKESLDGGSLAGAFDDAIDGVDAMLSPDTNILQVTWIATYEGKLKVTFGSREQGGDTALSHSLQIGSSTFRF